MKKNIRQEILKKRLMMDQGEASAASGRIIQTLLELDCIKNASCVMAYYSYRNEPNLLALMHALLEMGIGVALPYIAGNGSLIAVAYTYDSVMKSNVYGIAEPIIMNESERAEPAVVLVPGVAFDTAMNRIGYGVGYFDRFLKETTALKIGVCYDMQIVPEIAAEPYDVAMDMLVTDRRVIGPQRCA